MHCQFGPQGYTVGGIYVGNDLTLLHTKYISCGSHGFREEDFFFKFFPIISLLELMTPGAWPIWTPGTWFDRIYVDH